jgi:hypothetical protein
VPSACTSWRAPAVIHGKPWPAETAVHGSILPTSSCFQAHDQPQVPPAARGSGMAQGWARGWGVNSCGGIPSLVTAEAPSKAADATGYPLP